MRCKPKNVNENVYVKVTLRELERGDLFLNGNRDPSRVESGADDQYALYMVIEPTPELLRGYQEKYSATEHCGFILAVNLRNGRMYTVGARQHESGLDTKCWRVDGDVSFSVRQRGRNVKED